jgi:hypothetical protein
MLFVYSKEGEVFINPSPILEVFTSCILILHKYSDQEIKCINKKRFTVLEMKYGGT